MRRRILSILLTLCMVMVFTPITAQAGTTPTALTQDNISGYMDGTTLKNGTYYLNGDITPVVQLKFAPK